MIPKIIHYCWYGKGNKPALAKKCIESWKRYCPDYKIVEWNEDNTDLQMNPYVEWCYEEKKYAFLSDYIRLVVVEKYGGIYFDTDVELLRNIDFLLEHHAYFGFENFDYVASGLGFGSESGGKAVRAMIEEYQYLLDGKNGTEGCPRLNTRALIKNGLTQDGSRQFIADAMIYPIDWFNPYESSTGKLNMTENTVSIHWYAGSWMSKKLQLRSKITKPFHRLFGEDCFHWRKRKS